MTEPVADKGKKTQATASARAIPRLLQFYRDNIVPSLISEFGYKNVMEVPRLEKVVVNIGLGEALTNPKALESATNEIAQITGQQPVVTRAKKSIASFKLREGQSIGVMVTLRQSRMYYFLDKLLSAALPRVRDFRGVSRTAFDGRGNFALGLREQIIFPEIDYNQVEKMRGLQINIITTARSDREGLRLLELAGMPFTREATKAG
ncbi:MAG: 50S ribosomal protein L5 [SAR202 cluster bacterium]|nr:50S ribosomal protein L5 [SAR202 cluster bacterium]